MMVGGRWEGCWIRSSEASPLASWKPSFKEMIQGTGELAQADQG